MKTKTTILALAVLLLCTTAVSAQTYTPSEDNLAARRELKDDRFGIFLHWGIYSMFGQGEWYLNTGKLNRDEYAHAAAGFFPSRYDAREWVRAFKDAGASYVTITSRHHDGFSMFRTACTPYNIVDATPYAHDVIADLADACHEQGVALQFYYSLLDWMRDDYPGGGTVWAGSGKDPQKADYDSYFNFMKGQVKELLQQYAPVRALWFDGWWDHREAGFPWRMEEFYAYIHGLQPSCLVGNNHHRYPFEGEDFQMFERDFPGHNEAGFSEGQEVSRLVPLEMCQTMNNTWGYSVSDHAYKSSTELIRTLARAVSLDSNLLLNIGPRPDGCLPEEALDRLKEIGAWMRLNGASIRGCGPGPLAEQDWGVTTAPSDDPKVFYVHLFSSPGAVLELPVTFRRIASVTALADGSKLAFRKMKDKLYVTLPSSLPEENADFVIKVLAK